MGSRGSKVKKGSKGGVEGLQWVETGFWGTRNCSEAAKVVP